MTSDKPSTGSGQPRIYLTGLAICLAVLAPVAGLLVYTLVIHDFRFTSGALLTSAPLGRILTIAHVSGSVASLSVSFVLGTEAYRLARNWLIGTQSQPRGESANSISVSATVSQFVI